MTPFAQDMLAVRQTLDAALLGLRAISDPLVGVREAEREVAAALLHVYRALASAGDASGYKAESDSALSRTRAAFVCLGAVPTQDPGVEAEHERLALAIRLLNENPLPPEIAPDLPRPGRGEAVVRATIREPRLVHLDRTLLFPAVPLPPLEEASPAAPPQLPIVPPRLATDEDIARLLAQANEAIGAMADEPPPPEKEAAAPLGPPDDQALELEYLGVSLDEVALTVERARSAFEDLASFAMMRVPRSDEGWTSADRVERRLLARFDAILACGTWVLPRLVKVLEELPVPDPDMTWAALFAFGSIAGDDALDQAVRLVEASTLDAPDMTTMISDALSLAPHPGFEGVCRRWLAHPDAARRVIGVSVLGRRRSVLGDEVARAAQDPDRRVVVAAAEAFATAQGELPLRVLEGLLHHDDPVVVRAAIRSAMLRRLTPGIVRATELTTEGRGAFADAALFVALGSRHEAAAILQQSGAQGGSDVLVEALGWFGDLGSVEYLLEQASAEEPRRQSLAVEALHRLTGAGLTEADPAPEYPEESPPLRPRPGTPTEAGPLLVDPAPWRAWWEGHRKQADARKRYRFGHLWMPSDDVWQLASPASGTRARSLAHLELTARVGSSVAFDPREFVPRQERAIGQWRDIVAGLGDRVSPGTWPTNYR